MNSISARATDCSRATSSDGASSGRIGFSRASLYFVNAAWNSAKRAPRNSAAWRVHPNPLILMRFSSSDLDRGRDHGDSLRAVVRRIVKLLAEHIRVDLVI